MQTVIGNNWNKKSHRKAKKIQIPVRHTPRQICVEESDWIIRPRFRKLVATLLEGKQGWRNPRRHISQLRDIRLPIEDGFEKQKHAFKNIPPQSLEQYHGQFVAARDGVIVDSDNDLIELSRRFFEQHGDVPVYMTKVGETFMVRIPTPYLR